MRKMILLLVLSLFTSCTRDKSLKIAASSVPHADILQSIKQDLKDKGITIKIVEVDDFNLPNRLLQEKQVDANFFQHQPYLNEQIARFGYKIEPIAKVHIEPLGIYSTKHTAFDTLSTGALVVIPSDPTNGGRALQLLASAGLITLKEKEGTHLFTLLDIVCSSKQLKIQEVDAALMPRIYPDVDLAVMTANFALQAKLNPLENALCLESKSSPYANVLVVRIEDHERPEFKKLQSALNSEKLRTFILEKYKGALIPAF